jgi:hypothetical protein
MLKKKLTNFVSLLILFLMSTQSCSSKFGMNKQIVINPDHMDSSWMTGIPCPAPCWYGLELGKSRKEDVIAKVKELQFINAGSMYEMDTRIRDYSNPESLLGRLVTFNCKEPADLQCIYLRFASDTLYDILITPNYEVTFKQAVERIGVPDGLSYVRANPDTKGCYVRIIWVEHQMEIRHYEEAHTFGKDLCDRINEADNKMIPDLLVHDILYMPKDWVEEIWAHENYREWKGFITE